MECMGPQCAEMLLQWLRNQAAGEDPAAPARPEQRLLWSPAAYQEDDPWIRDEHEFEGAIEHLEYAVFRRYENQLTRAERSRLDNKIQNTLFKIERFLQRLDETDRARLEPRCHPVREAAREGRERSERVKSQARRLELKLAQLNSLTPEGFEEFVAEMFEALGFEVEVVGGTGDEGADLKLRRDGLLAVVQCKYHKERSRAIVGSPELQKFLGTIHHTKSHKGYFVTTRTFSLAAEKFVANHPIELIDGPRLVDLVHDVMGPGARREADATWF